MQTNSGGKSIMLERFGISAESENFRETSIYGLACVYSLIEKQIAYYLRPYHLTVPKFNALMVIKHIGKDTGLSQGELGRRLIVTPSNITRLLDRLEQDGYIERISRKGDRRVNLIRITKNGSDILDKVWPGYRNRINELANNLTQDEQKLLSKMMLEWFSKLNNGSKPL